IDDVAAAVGDSPPVTGANPPAAPHATTTPAPRPVAAQRPPAAPVPDLAGRTTNLASPGGAAAKAATSTAAKAARDPDDTSPLLTRCAWMGLAWGAISAASAAALAATGLFMFPHMHNETPQQFKSGLSVAYGMGVYEWWEEK